MNLGKEKNNIKTSDVRVKGSPGWRFNNSGINLARDVAFFSEMTKYTQATRAVSRARPAPSPAQEPPSPGAAAHALLGRGMTYTKAPRGTRGPRDGIKGVLKHARRTWLAAGEERRPASTCGRVIVSSTTFRSSLAP